MPTATGGLRGECLRQIVCHIQRQQAFGAAVARIHVEDDEAGAMHTYVAAGGKVRCVRSDCGALLPFHPKRRELRPGLDREDFEVASCEGKGNVQDVRHFPYRRMILHSAQSGNPLAHAGAVRIIFYIAARAPSAPAKKGLPTSITISSCTCSTICAPASCSASIASTSRSRHNACTTFSINDPP